MFLLPKYDSQGKETGFQSSKPLNSFASANDALMSFDDFYRQSTGYNVNPYGLFGRIDNFFTGKTTSAKQAYENYLADYEYKRNQEATAAANAEKYAREDSEVQRRMKDYAAAGLNPYLLLMSGSSGAATSSASEYAKYKRSSYKDKEAKESSKLISTAIRAIAIIAMLGS